MSVFGTQNYGKVDRIPGVGHVCTQFFHINFVPLCPVRSFFIFEGVGSGDVGVSIPWSPKSILVAWLRGGLVVGAFAAAIFGLVRFTDSKDAPADPLLATLLLLGAAGLVGLFFLTYRLGLIAHANYERAVSLGHRIGFNDETMLMIEILHGRLTAEQADAELARREQLAEQNQPILAEPISADIVEVADSLSVTQHSPQRL